MCNQKGGFGYMADRNYISSRESLVREAASLSNVVYGALLANMTLAQKREMFEEVDAIVYRLQHIPAMETDPRIKSGSYNSLTDKRQNTYDKFYSNAVALFSVTSPIELKALQVAIYKVNGEKVDGYDADFAARASLEYAKNPMSL